MCSSFSVIKFRLFVSQKIYIMPVMRTKTKVKNDRISNAVVKFCDSSNDRIHEVVNNIKFSTYEFREHNSAENDSFGLS